jgi:hypothetical protein
MQHLDAGNPPGRHVMQGLQGSRKIGRALSHDGFGLFPAACALIADGPRY